MPTYLVVAKTNREIRRCLVRYVARQLYRLLEATPGFDPTWERPRRDEKAHSGNVTVRALGVADAASFYQSWPRSKARPGSGASSRRTVSSWSP
jgi:hypothetical protein